ncbi:hypothetical protein [Brevibacterium aurantiacum]|uniref:Uncharacterized protein n=1 Tax=Brevibacterium aurantiacum TaxID=273384 RepID=A0A2H1KBP2_BREAU|nr:hypothetical protein [Brevibacterium aurantiacum]SMX96988.1 hypothetical protein BAURA63_03154 [Brevibacterium aurantiacum]
MKKFTGSALGAFILALITDPVRIVQNTVARLCRRIALAQKRLGSAPQAGVTTLEIIIWIGGIALLAIGVVALLKPLVDGWVSKIPK